MPLVLRNKLFWIERRVCAVFVFITLLEKDPSQNCPEIRRSQHVLGRLVINTFNTPPPPGSEYKTWCELKRLNPQGGVPENVRKCFWVWWLIWISGRCFIFFSQCKVPPKKYDCQTMSFVCLCYICTNRQYVPRSSNKRKINGLSHRRGSTTIMI